MVATNQTSHHNLQPWELQQRKLLHPAIMAYSKYNIQPWRIKLEQNQILLFADRDRRLKIIDPLNRAQMISCGSLLENICITLDHLGYPKEVKNFPYIDTPDLIADIQLGEPDSKLKQQNLFPFIDKQRFVRRPFELTPIDLETLNNISKIMAEHDLWHEVITTPSDRAQLTPLLTRSLYQLYDDPNFCQEYIHWHRSHSCQQQDGVSHNVYAQSKLSSFYQTLLYKFIHMGKHKAKQYIHLVDKSAAIIIVGTKAENPTEWLAAGRGLQKLLLQLTEANYCYSFLNAMIDVEETRSSLKEILARKGFPQIAIRIGRCEYSTPTPSRELTSFLL